MPLPFIERYPASNPMFNDDLRILLVEDHPFQLGDSIPA